MKLRFLRKLRFSIGLGMCLLWTSAAVSFGQGPQTDNVMRAMKDELQRSVKELQLNDLEKPYFIQYVVVDEDQYEAQATFGALESSDRAKQRYVSAQVRVGNYDFDNSEFVAGNGQPTTGVIASSVIEDDYQAIRHSLWLTTDAAYKQSVETLARKRAFVRNKVQEEQPPDFSKEKPTSAIVPKPKLEIDEKKWENQLRDWSKIFKQYPQIQTSSVTFSARLTSRYIVNSEGTETLQPELIVSLDISAGTQASDGMQLRHSLPIDVRTVDELPSAQAVTDSIKQFAVELSALRSAPVLDANYSGPVLLVGQASAEMFARVLAPNLSGQRPPLSERGGQQTASTLADRMNRPVLPSYLSVFDDPAEQRFDGKALIGHYDVDDQGVPARRVSLIEDGLLTNLLMSRRPGKDRLQSNGHGRSGYPGREAPQIGNLFIKSSETKSYDDLKKELIEAAKKERLQYGVMIKALEAGGGGRGGGFGNPVLTYKVYVADGREELIRGAGLGGLSVQSLRHIQAAGKDEFVANRLTGNNNFPTPVSVVAPSVLLEELELERPSGTQQKPAILTHPYFP
jgi:predicted Zn-dependent protease